MEMWVIFRKTISLPFVRCHRIRKFKMKYLRILFQMPFAFKTLSRKNIFLTLAKYQVGVILDNIKFLTDEEFNEH